MKQGCTLCSTLSNIYQNDIHDIFDSTYEPVELGGMILIPYLGQMIWL